MDGGRHHRRRGHADPRLFPQRQRPCRAPRDDAMQCSRCCHRAVNANRAKSASWPRRLDKMLNWAGPQILWQCQRSVVMQLSLGRSVLANGVNCPCPAGSQSPCSFAPTAHGTDSIRSGRIEGHGLPDGAHDMEIPASPALSMMNGRPTSITSSGRSATGRQTARPEAISGARWTKLSSVKVPS